MCTGLYDETDTDFFVLDVPADGEVNIEIEFGERPALGDIPHLRVYQGVAGGAATIDYMILDYSPYAPSLGTMKVWREQSVARGGAKLFIEFFMERTSTTDYFPINSYSITAGFTGGCRDVILENSVSYYSTSPSEPTSVSGSVAERFQSLVGKHATVLGDPSLVDDGTSKRGYFCGSRQENFWRFPGGHGFTMSEIFTLPSAEDSGNFLWVVPVSEANEELAEPVPLNFEGSNAGPGFDIVGDLLFRVWRSGSASDPDAPAPDAPFEYELGLGVSSCEVVFDSYEPNNMLTDSEVPSLSTDGSVTRSQDICPGRDVDWFKLDPVATTGVLGVTVTQSIPHSSYADGSRWRVHRLDAGGASEIVFPTILATPSVDTDNPSRATTFEVPVEAGVDYALETWSIGMTYRYVVESEVTECFEGHPTLSGVANDTTAPTLPNDPQTLVQGSFCPLSSSADESSDVHYYARSFGAAGAFSIESFTTMPAAVTPEDTAYFRGSTTGDCTSMTGCPIVELTIVDFGSGSETVVAGPIFNNETTSSGFVFSPSSAMDAFVRVRRIGHADALPSHYSFSITATESCVRNDAGVEPDNGFATARPLQNENENDGSICPSSDVDFYSFTAVKGGLLALGEASVSPGGAALSAVMFDERSNYSASSLGAIPNSGFPLFLSISPGTHYLSISPSETDVYFSSYSFLASVVEGECLPFSDASRYTPEDAEDIMDSTESFQFCTAHEGSSTEQYLHVSFGEGYGTLEVDVMLAPVIGQVSVDIVAFGEGDLTGDVYPTPAQVVAQLGVTAQASMNTDQVTNTFAHYMGEVDVNYNYFVRLTALTDDFANSAPIFGSVSASFSDSVCSNYIGGLHEATPYFDDLFGPTDLIDTLPQSGEVEGSICDDDTDDFAFTVYETGIFYPTLSTYNHMRGMSVHMFRLQGPHWYTVTSFSLTPTGDDGALIHTNIGPIPLAPGTYIVHLRGGGGNVEWYKFRGEFVPGACVDDAEKYATLGDANDLGDGTYDYYDYQYLHDFTTTGYDQPSFCPEVGDGSIYVPLPDSEQSRSFEVYSFIPYPEAIPYPSWRRSWYTTQVVSADGVPVKADMNVEAVQGVRSLPTGADPSGTEAAQEYFSFYTGVPDWVANGALLNITRTHLASSFVDGWSLEVDMPRIPHAQRVAENHTVSVIASPCHRDRLEPNDGIHENHGRSMQTFSSIDSDALFPEDGSGGKVTLPALTFCPPSDVDAFLVNVPGGTERAFPGQIVVVTITAREPPARACASDSDCWHEDVCSADGFCSLLPMAADDDDDNSNAKRKGSMEFSLGPISVTNDGFYSESFVLEAGESVSFPIWATRSFAVTTEAASDIARSYDYDLEVRSLPVGSCSMDQVRAAVPGSRLLSDQLLSTEAISPPMDSYLESGEDVRIDISSVITSSLSNQAGSYQSGFLCPAVNHDRWYRATPLSSSSQTVRFIVQPHDLSAASLLTVEAFILSGGGSTPVDLNGTHIAAGVPEAVAENGLTGVVDVPSNQKLVLKVSQSEASTTPVSFAIFLDNTASLVSLDCAPDRLAPNHHVSDAVLLPGSLSRDSPSLSIHGLSVCHKGASREQDAVAFVIDEFVTDVRVTVESHVGGEYVSGWRIYYAYNEVLGSASTPSSQSLSRTFEYLRPGVYTLLVNPSSLPTFHSNYSISVEVLGGFHGVYVADTDAQQNVTGFLATCGNGVVDEGEVCDPSAESHVEGGYSCCSSTCDGPRGRGVTCYQPSRSLGCAVPQVCDGESLTCPPPSEVLPVGTRCADVTTCGKPSYCDGTSALCPEPEIRVGESCEPILDFGDCSGDRGTCNIFGVCEVPLSSCHCVAEDPLSRCDADRNPCVLKGCDRGESACVSVGNAEAGTICSIPRRNGVIEGTCDGAGVCVEPEPAACPDDCTSPWHGTCVGGSCVCNPQMKGASCSEYAGPSTVTTDDGRDFDTLSPPCEIRFTSGTFTSVAGGRGARVESSCGAVAMLHLDAATAAEEGATIRFGATTGVGVDVPGAPLHHAGAFNAGEGVVMLFAPTASVGDDGVAALDASDAVEVMVTSVLLSAPSESIEAEAFFGVLNVHDDEDVLVPASPARVRSPRARFSGATALRVATHALLWNNGSSSSTAYFSLKSVTVQLVKLADGRSLTEDPLALAEPVEDDDEGEGEGEGGAPSTDEDDDDSGNGGAMATDATADAEGLSGGAVAGIVIGVLIAVALIVAATFMVATRMATGKTGGASSPPPASSSGTEMNTMSEPAASTTDLTDTKAEAEAPADADVDADKEQKEEV